MDSKLGSVATGMPLHHPHRVAVAVAPLHRDPSAGPLGVDDQMRPVHVAQIDADVQALGLPHPAAPVEPVLHAVAEEGPLVTAPVGVPRQTVATPTEHRSASAARAAATAARR